MLVPGVCVVVGSTVGVVVLVGVLVGIGVAVPVMAFVGVGFGVTLTPSSPQPASATVSAIAQIRYVIVFFILIPPHFFLRVYYLQCLRKLCCNFLKMRYYNNENFHNGGRLWN